jgi:hypothetical protein
MMCALAGQTTIATTAIVPREGKEYLKVICVRTGMQNTAAKQEVQRSDSRADHE